MSVLSPCQKVLIDKFLHGLKFFLGRKFSTLSVNYDILLCRVVIRLGSFVLIFYTLETMYGSLNNIPAHYPDSSECLYVVCSSESRSYSPKYPFFTSCLITLENFDEMFQKIMRPINSFQ